MAQTVEAKTNIDNVLTFIFLKKLMTPITKTEAFKLGLVNNTGKLLKDPETDDEKRALTILDKVMFKLKRLMGSKMTQLNNFLFLQTLSNDFYNKLVVRGSIAQRAEIKRIEKDVSKLAEKYDCEIGDIMSILINEELRKEK